MVSAEDIDRIKVLNKQLGLLQRQQLDPDCQIEKSELEAQAERCLNCHLCTTKLRILHVSCDAAPCSSSSTSCSLEQEIRELRQEKSPEAPSSAEEAAGGSATVPAKPAETEPLSVTGTVATRIFKLCDVVSCSRRNHADSSVCWCGQDASNFLDKDEFAVVLAAAAPDVDLEKQFSVPAQTTVCCLAHVPLSPLFDSLTLKKISFRLIVYTFGRYSCLKGNQR